MTDNQVEEQGLAEYEELKSAAKRTANWRERLKAVQELEQWENDQTINILKRITLHDPVYCVQEAAYRTLRKFGEDAKAPTKEKGELVKGLSKILLRIKKSLPEDHSIEDFKEKLKKTRIDVYDSYEGNKGEDFDEWLLSTWSGLVIRPRTK